MAGSSASDAGPDPRHGRRQWRFAPLHNDNGQAAAAPEKAAGGLTRLKGVIFDVDGTLCLPQNYMFREMRAALGIPRTVDILEHVRSLSDEPDVEPDEEPDTASSTTTTLLSSPQSRARETIRAIERRAMPEQVAQPGLQELMAYLHERNVRKALCTRNFELPVAHLVGKYLADSDKYGVFEPVVTRETEGVMPKPSPEGLWWIARSWGLGGSEPENTDADVDVLQLARRHLGDGLIMVGDSMDDMRAGYRAGAATVLLINDENQHLATAPEVDLVVRRLDELIDVLERGLSTTLGGHCHSYSPSTVP